MQVVIVYDQDGKSLKVHLIDAVALLKTGKYFKDPPSVTAPADVPVDSSGYDPADKKLKLDSPPEKKKPQDKDPERIDGGPQEVPVHFDRHFEHHSNTPVSDEDRAELKDKKADYIKPETEHVLDEKERGKKSRK